MPEANPYLETLQAPAATGAGPGNPYLDLLQSAETLRKTQTAAAVSQAVGTNPDEFARQKRVAQYLGYPLAAVTAMPDITKRQAQTQQVQQDIAASPVLQQRFTDADFARLAHDDTGVLSSLASAIGYLVSAPGRGNTLMGDIGAGVARGAQGAAGVFQGVAELPAPLLDWLEPVQAVGGNPLRRLAEGFATQGATAARTAERLSPPQAGTLAGGISSGVQSLTTNALALPLALFPGGQGAALGMMTAQTGGQSYQQAREQGLPMSQALPFAASQAAIEFATEKIPLARLIGDVKVSTPFFQTLAHQAALEIPGEQIATVLQDMNEWAILPENAGKSFKDYLAARPNAAAQTLIATLVGTGGNVTLTHALAKTFEGHLDGEAQQALAQQDAEQLKRVFSVAAQSALRERDPEGFATLVQDLADEAPDAPKEVRFDGRQLAETLQQSGLPEEELRAMLPTAFAQLDEAMATGGEVTVPVGEFSKVIGTPLDAALMQHARIGDNELSQAESKQAGEQAAALLKTEAQRVAAQAGDEAAQRVAAESVKTNVLDQLNTAGRFTPDVNNAYASLVRDFYVTMAGRLKTTPDELFKQFPLTVRAEGLGPIEQPAYHGTPHRGIEQFTTKAMGTGEGAQAYGWGLYFAQSKDIAEFYRKTLAADQPAVTIDGEAFDAAQLTRMALDNPTHKDVNVWKLAVNALNRGLSMPEFKAAVASTELPQEVKDAAEQFIRRATLGQGQTYVVEVPDDADMLDYDASLKDQPEKVRKGLAAAGIRVDVVDIVDRSGGTIQTVDTLEDARREIKARNLDAKPVARPRPFKGKWAYEQLSKKLGGDEAASRALFAAGIPGLRYLDANSRGAQADKQTRNYVIFDDSAVKKTGELYQGPRGTFNPAALNITLLQDADLSTFLHETGHFFLDMLWRFASDPQAPADVQTDMAAVLKWFKTTPEQWAAWTEQYNTTGKVPAGMRKQHERFAEGFEQYLLEGKAPSLELQPLFSKFRSWLLNVYKSLKDFLAGRGEASGPAGELGQSGLQTVATMEAMPAGPVVVDPVGFAPGKTTYRETSIDGLNDLLLDDNRQTVRQMFVTDNVDLALGQGDNKGVMVEFRPDALSGAEHKKPGTGDAAGREYRTDMVAARAVASFTVPKGFSPKQLRKLAQSALRGFDAQTLPDGRVKYIRKGLDTLAQANQKTPLGLTDEVRGVFDRLLASQEQIARAEALRSFDPLKVPGMAPAERAGYEAAGAKATDKALDTMSARSVRDMRWLSNARSRALKALQQDAAAKRKEVEAEVRAEVAKEPVRQAIRWLRKGEMTTAEGEQIRAEKGYRLNTEALAEMYPESMLARPDLEKLKGLTAGNGLHPDVVAGMLGFSSGDELVRSVIDAEPEASVVEGMTDQRMLERYGDLATEAGMQRAADEAVHNEARGRFLATGLKALQDAQAEKQKTPRGGSVSVMVRAAKDFAAQLVARRKVRDLRAGQHTAAEARAGKAAQKALTKGDVAGAITAQRDQLLNHYAARETYAALDEVDKALAYLKKFDKDAVRKKLPPEYLDQIDKLLERVELRQRTLRELDKRAKLADWIKSQEDLGIGVQLPPEVAEDVQLTNYQDMTLEAFRGLVDTVKQVEHLGPLKSKLLTARDERERAVIFDEMAAAIRASKGGKTVSTRTPVTNTERRAAQAMMFASSHLKVATLAKRMDQKAGGPVWNYLVRPTNEAANTQGELRIKATESLLPIESAWHKRRDLNTKREVPGVFLKGEQRAGKKGSSITLQQALGMALNTGNESNMQRLMGGELWTEDQVRQVIKQFLTADDLARVQKVWDTFEQYRPMIGALEREVRGTEPEWIEAAERTWETADGKTVTLRGGYFPVKFDRFASERAGEQQDAETAKRQLQNAYSAATVRRGFTKERVEEVHGRPLVYSLETIHSALEDTIHYLSWQRWLIDANRMLRADSPVAQAIHETYGPHVLDQFKSWRDDIAEGEGGVQKALGTFTGRLRQNVSFAGLAYNFTSAAIQVTGLTNTAVRLGPTWAAKGLGQYLSRGPLKAVKEVQAKSKFMEQRTRTRWRDLNELTNAVRGETKAWREMRINGMRMIAIMQLAVDTPTWLGAYEKAINDGMFNLREDGTTDDAKAVAMADQAVVDSQGGGRLHDLSQIERGKSGEQGVNKLFTVFYTFQNVALNLGYDVATSDKSRGRKAAEMLLLTTVPIVLTMAIKAAITPGDDDDFTDWEKLVKAILGEHASFLLGLFVGVREFSDAGKWLSSGKQPTSYAGPVGLRALTDAYKFAEQARQGDFDDAFRKATINLAGDVFGIPSAAANKAITGVQALAEGKTQNPAAAVLGYQEPR